MQGYSGQLAPDGHPVNVIALRNAKGCRVEFMDWGATWLSCVVPLYQEQNQEQNQVPLREVLLRSPNLQQYLQQNAYLGATVGRYANRIANAEYPLFASASASTSASTSTSISARRVRLSANDNGHSLHGGPVGFDSRRWQVESHNASKVVFRLVSQDGDQGFPGRLDVRACYELGPSNAITASFEASTDKPCPVNLANHAYFNLASSHDSVLQHELQIQAEHFLPVLESGIPAAELRPVAGTRFDFRVGRRVGVEQRSAQIETGYDHAFLLDSVAATGLEPVASLLAPDRKLQLTIATTKPALQVYTGNHLGGLPGAAGKSYAAHAGIALETQFLPDAPNHPEWPHTSSILLPGQRYAYQTTFEFNPLS